MGIHDRLAKHAASLGKSAIDFNLAAQRHANAAWIILIIAGAAWYFWGWMWAAVPAIVGAYTVFQSVSSTMIASRLEKENWIPVAGEGDDVMSIIQAYGRILETDAPAPGTVADSRKLPYPKETIKAAIIAALQATADNLAREHLKVGYVCLADWQDGVGDQNQGIDIRALDEYSDVESLAAQIVAAGETGKDWVEAAQREREFLSKQLESLGI